MAGTPVAGQTVPVSDDVAGFVAAARAATERYRQQSTAIADGYRRIGPDFPSMGEHWVSVPLVVRGDVDPLHPPILEYVTVAGEPMLAGVAYTQLVRDGPPRAPLPAPSSAWHYHAGSVDEESFILGHARRSGGMDSAPGPRIAVLHAWLWLDNPAGLFATDNWALPWHRLAIRPPPESDGPSPAGLAAALASGGEAYFLALLRLRDSLSAERVERVAALLDRYGRDWRARFQVVATEDLPLPVTELSGAWSALETELRRVCETCILSPHAGHE
jgi:hypothetical protein